MRKHSAINRGRDTAALLRRVVGPFERHCAGCPLAPDAAYVAAPFIGMGVTRTRPAGSETLDRIVAFDRAEAEWANLTQVNMVTVSSFCGLQGLLLGYDLLLGERRAHPLLGRPSVLDAGPLFDASRALLGTVRERRFPVAPGQHLLCAAKTTWAEGPAILYGAMAVAIPDRRDQAADLFLEDHGALPISHITGEHLQATCVLERLIDAVGQIGENVGVTYREIFVGLRATEVHRAELGCVLTAAPYLHLARQAIPHGNLRLMEHMSVADWEQAVTLSP